MSRARPALCIIAHDAYGALAGGQCGYVGGVEWQTTLTARWFAARGYRVSLVTWDEGQPAGEEIDGVRVLPVCRRDAGLRGLRFVHPRWGNLCRALRAAQADVYYHNSAEEVTGQVAWWCRRHGASFVYAVASNPDCDARLPQMPAFHERVFLPLRIAERGRGHCTDADATGNARLRLPAAVADHSHALSWVPSMASMSRTIRPNLDTLVSRGSDGLFQ